ncbi:MAG: AAA family ATPase [Eubacteriales bacterium]
MSNSNNSNTNMIKSIDKIKHQILDINTPVMCKKYNLIFGYNGTGKTTLSKIFKEIETSKQLEQSHYRIISDDQTPYIRVFYGEDYIKDNIVGDNIDPIIFSIGEEFAEKKKKKEKLVSKLSKLEKIIAKIGKKQSAICREKDTLLSENAKNIKDRYSIPNYTKLTLMRDITTLQPEIDVCLSLDAEKLNSEIQKNLAIFSNKQNMRTIEKVNIPIAFINKEAYQKFIQELSVLLIKPQNAENIFTQIKYEYENENSDFQSFIQYGIKHTKFVKEKKCPFCFNELGSLFDSFLEYFNDNVRKHQDKLVLLEDKFSSFFQKR